MQANNPASSESKTPPGEGSDAKNFIREIIDRDLESGKHKTVVTRFPPEPNGYLHIGHAKSICLNFGLARDYGGVCHLRFDDTNPTTEDVEYVQAIQRDVRWLGFDWGEKLFFASGYYDKLYEFAEELIRRGKAYICSLNEEDVRKYRGTITEAGIESPYRNRSVEENLDLFRRMKKGEFQDGAHVLRAKIDMANPNMKMRDPPLYRIRHAHHYKTGDTWCIYPLYDFAHALSDWIESITHSICTLEFENNRELYDWFLEALELPKRPQQIEFARLNLTYTVMSKRKLLELVGDKHVSGWDDPRMPTLAGMRRRGVTPEALRDFCDRIGVAKNNSIVEFALFEHVLRENLNQTVPRVMCVQKPLKVVIENLPDGYSEELDAPYFPVEMKREGSRKVPFSKVLYIERDDFMLDPPKDYYRLAPGREVRLRHAYVIRCEQAITHPETGEITELRCTYDPASRNEGAQTKRIKGTIHWVSAEHSKEVEVRLYDRLFQNEEPGSSGAGITTELNPNSLTVLRDCRAEPSLIHAKGGERFQFERLGFFFADPIDSKEGAPVFNRTVGLKDTWAKVASRAAAPATPEKTQAPKESKAAPKVETKTEKALSEEAQKLKDAHGLSPEDARMIGEDPARVRFFEEALTEHNNAKLAAKWMVNEVLRENKGANLGDLACGGKALGELLSLLEAGTLSAPQAKEVCAEMLKTGEAPKAIVAKKGVQQISDTGAILEAVNAVIAENADAVGRFRAGNANVMGALVGMVLKKTGGKANPKMVNEVLRKQLGAV